MHTCILESCLRECSCVFPGGYSLDDVILVGGATRMPAVQRVIRGLTGLQAFAHPKDVTLTDHHTRFLVLGVKPRITVNPDEAVSLGAAVLAGTLDGSLSNMQVMSTWKAAIYRAFYENYSTNQKNKMGGEQADPEESGGRGGADQDRSLGIQLGKENSKVEASTSTSMLPKKGAGSFLASVLKKKKNIQ